MKQTAARSKKDPAKWGSGRQLEGEQRGILRRRIEYLTALHETAIGLLDLLDKEELLETILYRAALLSGTRHGYIYLLDPDGASLQMQVGMGFFRGPARPTGQARRRYGR